MPEQMFSTDTAPAYGVSAVKAIQLAAAHGQKIYTINQANLESALTAINLNSSTEQEIRDAVNSGKVVTTHTHRVNFHGTVTAGYIIQDPVDGTGAYKIASGADGAEIKGEQRETLNNADAFITFLEGIDAFFETEGFKPITDALGKFVSGAIFVLDIYETIEKCVGRAPVPMVITLIVLQAFFAILIGALSAALVVSFGFAGFIAALAIFSLIGSGLNWFFSNLKEGSGCEAPN